MAPGIRFTGLENCRSDFANEYFNRTVSDDLRLLTQPISWILKQTISFVSRV